MPNTPLSTKVQFLLGADWSWVVQLADLAAQQQAPLMLVGGLIRDALLPQQDGATGWKDIDLVIEGDARAFCQQIVHAFGGSVVMSKNPFLTCRWHAPGGIVVDVATARVECYAAPGALPSVRPAELSKDLIRRDFTINAMALDLRPETFGQLMDPFQGQLDLKDKKLRVLHPQSFMDDPTRLFRAARFAARFACDFEAYTQVAAAKAVHAKVFAHISDGRVGEQWQKVFEEQAFDNVVGMLNRQGTLHALGFSLEARRKLSDLTQVAIRISENKHALTQAEMRIHRSHLGWMALSIATDGPLWQKALSWSQIDKKVYKIFMKAPAALRSLRVALEHEDKATLYRVLARLNPLQREFAQGLVDPVQQALLHWWEQAGQYIKTNVDGQYLQAMGFTPGPRFAPAIAAALDIARLGGNATAQYHAAVAVLQDHDSKILPEA